MSKSSAVPTESRRNIKAYILGLVIGLVFSGLTLLFFSLIIWLFELPTSYGEFFASLAFGAGCLSSGIFMGWIKRKSGLVKGAKAALFFILPIIAVSVILNGFTGELVFERIITAIICGSVGGIIGVNKKKH